MSKYDLVLFDLDGTITDSKPGIFNSIRFALARYNIEESDSGLMKFFGPPLQETFKKYYPKIDPNQATEYYHEYFKEKGLFENQIYPGMIDILSELKNQSKNIVIATAKPTVLATKVLEFFELTKFFDSIDGSNLDGTKATKTELIRNILKRYDIPIEKVVMIGDKKHDIIGATDNNINSIFVKYGYGSEEDLNNCNPTIICDTVEDLKKALF